MVFTQLTFQGGVVVGVTVGVGVCVNVGVIVGLDVNVGVGVIEKDDARKSASPPPLSVIENQFE